jgi:GTP cyclohydrolase I
MCRPACEFGRRCREDLKSASFRWSFGGDAACAGKELGMDNNGKSAALESSPIQQYIREMLKIIGEDPSRPGLKNTPQRFEKALRWMTRGYTEDIDRLINNAVFPSDCDEMVLVRDIDFFSLCEHHLLPFFGKVHVAYLPTGSIIGLSKLPRIVEVFARRLQVQEELTMQIAKKIEEQLKPKGVGVVVQGYHLCMMMRGVEKQNTLCVTSAMLGRFKHDPRTRAEFLELIKLRNPA